MAADWASIRVQYVGSALTFKAIGDRHGLKEGTVRQRANREGWVEQRNAASRAVTQKAEALLTESRVDELARFNRDDLEMAQAIRVKAQSLMRLTNRPADLRALAGAVESAQKVGRLALGAATENTSVTTKELPASVDEFV